MKQLTASEMGKKSWLTKTKGKTKKEIKEMMSSYKKGKTKRLSINLTN